MSNLPLRQGSCHCGAVRFNVRLAGELDPHRCNCTFCAMRGGVAVTARLEDFAIVGGEDSVRTYQFNTRTAEHHFCGVCGIYTHHRRRMNPDEVSINVACLGFSPFDFACLPVFEGQVHPNDRTDEPWSEITGYLRFEKTKPS